MIFLALVFALSGAPAFADDSPALSIEVGRARVKRAVAAFPAIVGDDKHLAEVREVAVTDLDFSGLMDFLNSAAFLEDAAKSGITPSTFKMSDWSSIGAELLIKAKGSVEAGMLTLELRLYSVTGEKELLARRYRAPVAAARRIAHALSSDVVLGLTGKRGPFTARIAFVSDKSGRKEIYVMDYDGHNPIQVTRNFAQAIAPAWSPDGKQLLFTALTKDAKNVANHDLWSYDLASRKFSRVSERKGINSGAVFSPDGKQIALTMSFSGNAEIYTLDPATKETRRLTEHFASDVDPAWSPDGKRIAFVSDRPGKPMVYLMDASGANVQRLTFAGDYNSSPAWGDGRIAFTSWRDAGVDLFLVDPDGSHLERLTKGEGKNESPDFAPGGYFLAYSSNRAGKRNIYVTSTDGTVHRQVTKNLGNCETPRWGPAN
jgi:TolB protein